MGIRMGFASVARRAAGLAMAAVLAIVLSGDGAAAAAKDIKTVGVSTADHSKFSQLQKDFKTGPEVTTACLECHTEASKQVHATKHWTWDVINPETGRNLGKKNVINNFCGAVASNEARCTSCHVGYGWKDDSFDFTVEENVD